MAKQVVTSGLFILRFNGMAVRQGLCAGGRGANPPDYLVKIERVECSGFTRITSYIIENFVDVAL